MADHYLFSPLPGTQAELEEIIDRHGAFVKGKGAGWARMTMFHAGNAHDELPWGLYTQAWHEPPETDAFEFPRWRTIVNREGNN